VTSSPALDNSLRESASEAVFQPLKLGEKVRELRRSHGLTLDEVSKRTGLAFGPRPPHDHLRP